MMNMSCNLKLSKAICLCMLVACTLLMYSGEIYAKQRHRNQISSTEEHAKINAKIVQIIRTCAPTVAESTMQALTRHESGWKQYAIAINRPKGRLEHQPRNKSEAIETAKDLLSRGYNFDMGFAQINSANLTNSILTKNGVTIETIFDVCTNVRAGADILTDCFLRARKRVGNEQQALHAALSCYNTGNFSGGIRNGYVNKVYQASRK